MIVDANILLYAVDRDSPWHDPARGWLEAQMNGAARVGLPWQSLTAFLRVSTHPRALAHPLRAVDAWAYVQAWLNAPTAWTPGATDRHAAVLRGLVERYAVTGNLVSDAHLAALAIEHGVAIASADTDFARFAEIRWVNPVRPREA